MAAVKLIIVFGILAVALAFPAPENIFEDPNTEYEDESPPDDGEVLVRNSRSPFGNYTDVDDTVRYATNANVNYQHTVDKNWDINAGASKNFQYSENGGYAGITYTFRNPRSTN